MKSRNTKNKVNIEKEYELCKEKSDELCKKLEKDIEQLYINLNVSNESVYKLDEEIKNTNKVNSTVKTEPKYEELVKSLKKDIQNLLFNDREKEILID